MHPHDATLGLYMSVPFCRQKCTFCNFASDAFPPARMTAYVDRLVAEVEASREFAAQHQLIVPQRVDSVFLGGGTPSLLEPEQMARVFAVLRATYPLEQDAEITVEAAPGQISDDLLDVLLRSGVNRISLGVQSFVDAESRAVGRVHTGDACLAELNRLRAAGISNLNVDLIAGLPHQTAASWSHSLQTAMDAGVEHVSVYMLEVDEDSRLGRELIGPGVRYGAHAAPTDSLVADLYTQACEKFDTAGLAQYEISNFARAGYASRHNLKYWKRDAYFGFGLDAHSMLRAQNDSRASRFANGDELDPYIAGSEAVEVEHINMLGEWEESIFLGLRLIDGVSIAELQQAFPASWVNAFAERVQSLQRDGLMRLEDGRAMLTQHGRIVSSSIFGELLADEPAVA
ncbi:radical SAM family heme chaperone HemW [Terriglobus roseus]|uniref:Heme chaperone HemW n=1 Tax=Terriglobus roseus TaxID=392734 RepID=A0A1G7IT01_9BACT|nr:radical SAM family heme chaperone HemW [Terriglobus roseus]SDF15684.1 oxygen-independent coproporphyrinogen-3 oxidase [Terriglobus roseus]